MVFKIFNEAIVNLTVFVNFNDRYIILCHTKAAHFDIDWGKEDDSNLLIGITNMDMEAGK